MAASCTPTLTDAPRRLIANLVTPSLTHLSQPRISEHMERPAPARFDFAPLGSGSAPCRSIPVSSCVLASVSSVVSTGVHVYILPPFTYLPAGRVHLYGFLGVRKGLGGERDEQAQLPSPRKGCEEEAEVSEDTSAQWPASGDSKGGTGARREGRRCVRAGTGWWSGPELGGTGCGGHAPFRLRCLGNSRRAGVAGVWGAWDAVAEAQAAGMEKTYELIGSSLHSFLPYLRAKGSVVFSYTAAQETGALLFELEERRSRREAGWKPGHNLSSQWPKTFRFYVSGTACVLLNPSYSEFR